MNARTAVSLGLAAIFCLPASPAFAQAPARTFAELKAVLKPGQSVIVTDAKNGKTTGKVVSVGDGQLEIKNGRRQFTFGEDAVRRIEKNDSSVDGILIGGAIGMLLGYLVATHPSSTSEGGEAALGGGIIALGIELGDRIDSERHRTIYVAAATAAPTAPPAPAAAPAPTAPPVTPAAAKPTFVEGRPAAPAVSFLVPASRVRVRATSMSIASEGVQVKDEKSLKVVGLVEAIDAERVMIASDRNLVKIPVASITSVDVSVGKKRNTLWGLVAGLGVGVVTGLAASVDPRDCSDSSTNFCSRGAAVGGATLFMGGLGAVLGAITKTDRWERRYPPPAGK